jgi:hypothetical protein
LAAEFEPNLVSLTLPSEIPFNLVLPKNGGVGYVTSKEFWITNNGSGGIEVTLDSARVNIDNIDSFALVNNAPLPENGSNLYLSLICTQNGNSTSYVLADTPSTTHSYWLESGESASFRMDGLVSERGETVWSETTVTVSLCFTVMTSLETENKIAPTDSSIAENDPDGTEEEADADHVASEQNNVSEFDGMRDLPNSEAVSSEAVASEDISDIATGTDLVPRNT